MRWIVGLFFIIGAAASASAANRSLTLSLNVEPELLAITHTVQFGVSYKIGGPRSTSFSEDEIRSGAKTFYFQDEEVPERCQFNWRFWLPSEWIVPQGFNGEIHSELRCPSQSENELILDPQIQLQKAIVRFDASAFSSRNSTQVLIVVRPQRNGVVFRKNWTRVVKSQDGGIEGEVMTLSQDLSEGELRYEVSATWFTPNGRIVDPVWIVTGPEILIR